MNKKKLVYFFFNQYGHDFFFRKKSKQEKIQWKTYLTTETIIFQIFRWMHLTVEWLVDGHLFSGLTQLIQLDHMMVLKAAHTLMGNVTTATQKGCTITASRNGSFLVLA
jgi:hypothetical protein